MDFVTSKLIFFAKIMIYANRKQKHDGHEVEQRKQVQHV